MQLRTITFSGADESVAPNLLAGISDCHSEVEWAILFSKNHQGRSLRYPSPNWIRLLFGECGRSTKLAAHICGDWARWCLDGVGGLKERLDWVNFPFELFAPKRFQRLQLNISAGIYDAFDPKALEPLFELLHVEEIILQARDGFKRADELAAIYGDRVSLLSDKSGGCGQLAESWPAPVPNVQCGYAGGLGPEVLEEQLKTLAVLCGERDIWVDMETNIRQDNLFDVGKVNACIGIAGMWF